MPSLRYRLARRLSSEVKDLELEYHDLRLQMKKLPLFVDPQVVSYLQESELTTDGQIQDVCIMFTDVRGFTSYAERNSLAAANCLLNNFYDIVVHHTRANGGLMDKFTGDGTMSLFGAFQDKRSQSRYTKGCVRAAREIMQDFVDMTNQKGEPNLFLGIGIAKGEVMLGTLGNGEFLNFTAIGHEVNIAARLQGRASNNQIYATNEVIKHLASSEYLARGRHEFKNVSKKVPIFEVLR